VSLAIKYETVDDARLRLRNTVVRYKDQPVYITNINRGEGGDDILRVLFTELPTAKNPKRNPFDDMEPVEGDKRKYISSKFFDISPFKMGYVNSKTGAYYTERMPNRIQKQGLCAENFRGVTNFGTQVAWQTFIGTPEMVEMIAGKYPTFDQALTALKKCPAVAFNREFCLVKDEVVPDLIYLYHKGKKVGYYSHKETILGNQFKCLKESLEEMQIKVGVAA
jgi:hypothetical protein